MPLITGTPVAAGMPMAIALRIVDVGSFAVTIGLLVWGVMVLTRGSWITAVLSAFVLATTSIYLVSYQVASSESVFTPLCLAAIGLLVAHLATGRRWPLVAWVAVAALAAITRFTGLAVIGTGVVALLLWTAGSWRARTVRAALLGGAALVPFVVWMTQDALGAPGGAGSLSYHPPEYSQIFVHLSNFANGGRGWVSFEPTTWPGPVRVLVAVGVLTLVVLAVWTVLRAAPQRAVPDRRAAGDVASVLVRTTTAFLVVYFVALFASMTFFHAAPFTARYLFPVLPVAIGLVGVALHALATGVVPRLPRPVGVAIAIAIALPVLVMHAEAGRASWDPSREARNPDLRQPGTLLSALSRRPDREIVFTSAPDAVWLATDRYAISLPPTWSIWTKRPNADYPRGLDEIRRVLCERPGVIALFTTPTSRAEEALMVDLGMQVEERLRDGIVLGVDPARCP
jgi:4-amino-4-deoxy-L-arabinose transferase-like glycosyltransferase